MCASRDVIQSCTDAELLLFAQLVKVRDKVRICSERSVEVADVDEVGEQVGREDAFEHLQWTFTQLAEC